MRAGGGGGGGDGIGGRREKKDGPLALAMCGRRRTIIISYN
jgi:hypothetical protein